MAASSSLSGSWGPSPRGRGHRRSTARGYSQGGSIPARAGSPALNKFEKLLERVHPRAGGVTTTDIPTGMHGVGPSPRGRGHRPNHPDQRAISGSIPARAGSPAPPPIRLKTTRVHPRAGGVTLRKARRSPAGRGPSPRGRGHLEAWLFKAARRGSIPARAGSPRLPGRCGGGARVHPRAGGVTPDQPNTRHSDKGPSPRGRGHPGATARLG